MSNERFLRVVNYHYVRDLPNSNYPRIKGLHINAFRSQVKALQARYIMATMEQTMAFLSGEFQPSRDLCLLTFDDGLKEHYSIVTPYLAENNIQGLFFLTTACIEEHSVLSVHKNHFLMASLEFQEYRNAFLTNLAKISPETNTHVDPIKAAATYRFDTQDVAELKLLLNFHLNDSLRQQVLDGLFQQYLGDEFLFAQELYVDWNEARAMQELGMILGGHSHRHIPLPKLGDAGQREDLRISTELLRKRLLPQQHLPFSYPYGNPVASFNEITIGALQELGYSCAFTTQVNPNAATQDWFLLNRFDTVDVKF
jgi:peptidoglycan/xylan/chitin deacetylase (PgdA/CDA1 family)